ncbi:phospho-sugar glycosidase domain-containing protein, partial [Bacillus sp. D-CC]
SIVRKKGSITIDNELYGRYAGEMQVATHDLLVDEKVNVVGMVVEEDVSLLPYIGAGKMFQIFCAIE